MSAGDIRGSPATACMLDIPQVYSPCELRIPRIAPNLRSGDQRMAQHGKDQWIAVCIGALKRQKHPLQVTGIRMDRREMHIGDILPDLPLLKLLKDFQSAVTPPA